jgi:GNAT superfamily N-acetyltransferase
MLFSHLSPDEQARHVAYHQGEVAQGRTNLDGLIVALDPVACPDEKANWPSDASRITAPTPPEEQPVDGTDGDARLRGVVYCREEPGRAGLLWPPRLRVTPGMADDDRLRQALIRAALEHLSHCEVNVVQCLLNEASCVDVNPLLATGFRHVAQLLYLVCTDGHFPEQIPEGPLEFTSWDVEHEARFAQLVEATYQGTRDCPALNGKRDIQDVLAGYRATGEFAPQRWLTVTRQGETVGCLILAEHAHSQQWELVYMGTLPHQRGGGLGYWIVRHAQWLAREAGSRQLLLAVDAENDPALRIYGETGFTAWDQRTVYLRFSEDRESRP